jgi:hypothetical protein
MFFFPLPANREGTVVLDGRRFQTTLVVQATCSAIVTLRVRLHFGARILTSDKRVCYSHFHVDATDFAVGRPWKLFT